MRATADGVRPTSARVRAAIFDSLSTRTCLTGARVLDLFAGSGALGLEAYSQGAAWVVFVEPHRRVIETLKKNIAQLKLTSYQVIHAKAEDWLKNPPPTQPFDIALLDAPYHFPVLQTTLELLAQPGWLKTKALIAAETHHHHQLNCPPSWTLQKNIRHGDTLLRFYQVQAPPN